MSGSSFLLFQPEIAYKSTKISLHSLQR